MAQSYIPLGRIYNIPIKLDYSWFLIFILLTWSLARFTFPAEASGWNPAGYWMLAAVTSVLFFACVLLHELGHSVVALRFRLPVREITLFIFGGVAQIQAVDPSPTPRKSDPAPFGSGIAPLATRTEPAILVTTKPDTAGPGVLTARSEFWMALAGPLTSLALGLCFYLLTLIFSWFTPLELLAKYLAFINITLALFNLVPGFPLDGGRIFRAVWWGISHNFQQATSVSVAIGQLVAMGFILYGIWQLATGTLANGVWFIFLGWFLDNAANRQRQQQSLRELLGEHQVSEAATRSYVIIPCCITLQKLADDHILGTGRRFYIVEDEQENICGIVTLHDVTQVPRDRWSTTNVEQIMVPLEKMRQVKPDNSLWDSLEHMDQEGVNQLPVILDGQLVGVLSRDGIISFLKRQPLQK